MPLLTTKFGSKLVFEQLPTDLRASDKINQRAKIAIAKLKTTPKLKVLYCDGFNVACKVSYGLLPPFTRGTRSGRLVHQLAESGASMIRAIQKKLPILKLHVDLSPDDWDIRRGLQILRRKVYKWKSACADSFI